MLTKYIIDSAKSYDILLDNSYMQNLFITNAIMCARKGENYRSDNIKLKECTLNCKEYLQEQIDIIKPKIILTLGYYPLYSISKLFHFEIEVNLTKTIEEVGVFHHNNMVIIPLYHPSAQISKERQLEQYNLIWKHYKPKELLAN